MVVDSDDGKEITNITRINLYINTYKKVCLELTVKDVELDLEVEKIDINEHS